MPAPAPSPAGVPRAAAARLSALLSALLLIVLAAACSGGGADGRAGDGTSAPAAGRWWKPRAGLTWQWQLSGTVDTSVPADVYDVDLFDTPAATVAALHRAGRRAICYTSIGSAETWRPDHRRFPPAVLGKKVQGWEDERWVDIRRLDVVLPIWESRLDRCARKGFDGVEPDWMDGFQHDTGFPLTAAQQLASNRALADAAHRRGLAIGLKNDLDQIPDLVGTVDFAVNEQCAEFSECDRLIPFVRAGKPVFHAEYDLPAARFCAQSARLGLSSVRKPLRLPAARETCPS